MTRYGSILSFQSTHPRGVRRLNYSLNLIRIFISIHAPTWGATVEDKDLSNKINISIHAPTWGATFASAKWLSSNEHFNPRTHVGCDERTKYNCLVYQISIHAPTWGATVKPSNGWLLGHKDNEFANENIIIINSVNIT